MSTINYVTRIEFADGEIRRLPDHLTALGFSRPLVATDPGLVASGLVARVVDLLPRGTVVFDQTPANPTEAAVRAAHARYVEGAATVSSGSAAARRLTSPRPSASAPAMTDRWRTMPR